MKISCDSCQAKFTVGDDKVAGNILRIRCKKCGSTLVVNGADGTTTTEPAGAAKDAPVVEASPTDAPPAAVKEGDSASKEAGADEAKAVSISTAPDKIPERESLVAARREGSRDQRADLFAGVDKAGSETESAAAEEAKLTGERGPSSVLFSLGSLTKDIEKAKESDAKAAKEEESKTTAKGDGSGLIDIRSLTGKRTERSSSPPRGGVDDIMNLGGGGAFGAALGAPDLTAPAVDVRDSKAPPAPAEEKGSNKIVYTIIGCAVFLGVAIVAAIIATRPSDPVAVPTKPTGTPALSGALAQNDPPAGSATAAPTPVDTSGAKVPGQLPTTAPSGAGKPLKPGAPGEPVASASAAAPPAPPPAPTKPLTLEEQMRKTSGTAAPVATAETPQGGAFDRAAASGSLNAVNISGCKKPDGPTGAGHVSVTFDPSGSVSTAIIDGGDFPGTPVGGCIAGKFRSAHVPPFSGSPVKVGKSFNL